MSLASRATWRELDGLTVLCDNLTSYCQIIEHDSDEFCSDAVMDHIIYIIIFSMI